MLEHLVAVLGGRIYDKRVRANRRRTWTWLISDWQKVRVALTDLLPHLILKRREAEVLLAYLEARQPHQGVRYSSQERAQGDKVYWALRRLKKGRTFGPSGVPGT